MPQLPVLQTARLVLRPFSIEDSYELHRMWCDDQMRKFLWDDRVISLEEARQTVAEAVTGSQKTGIGMWSIARKEQIEPMIGFCGLRFIASTPEIELLYGLLPAYWKKGFAVESVHAIVDYLFENFRVEQVFAGSDPLNQASFGVMKRLGMQPVPEGTVPVPGALYYRLMRSLPER